MRPPLCSAGHVTPSAVRDPPLSYRSWPPVAPTDPPRCTRAPQNRSSPRDTPSPPAAAPAFRATRRSRTPPRDTRAPLASVLPAELTALARHRLPGARFATATTLLPALSRGTRHRRRLSRGSLRPGQRLPLLAGTRDHYAGDETPLLPQRFCTGPHAPLVRHVRFSDPLPLTHGCDTVSPAGVAGHCTPPSSMASHSAAAEMSRCVHAYCTRASPRPTLPPPNRRASPLR